MSNPWTDGPWEQVDQIVGRINHKIETCYQRVACPKCKAPIGKVCRRMPIGYQDVFESGRPTKHPHEERWTQEVPKR